MLKGNLGEESTYHKSIYERNFPEIKRDLQRWG